MMPFGLGYCVELFMVPFYFRFGAGTGLALAAMAARDLNGLFGKALLLSLLRN
jgi:hypothetical protein